MTKYTKVKIPAKLAHELFDITKFSNMSSPISMEEIKAFANIGKTNYQKILEKYTEEGTQDSDLAKREVAVSKLAFFATNGKFYSKDLFLELPILEFKDLSDKPLAADNLKEGFEAYLAQAYKEKETFEFYVKGIRKMVSRFATSKNIVGEVEIDDALIGENLIEKRIPWNFVKETFSSLNISNQNSVLWDAQKIDNKIEKIITAFEEGRLEEADIKFIVNLKETDKDGYEDILYQLIFKEVMVEGQENPILNLKTEMVSKIKNNRPWDSLFEQFRNGRNLTANYVNILTSMTGIQPDNARMDFEDETKTLTQDILTLVVKFINKTKKEFLLNAKELKIENIIMDATPVRENNTNFNVLPSQYLPESVQVNGLSLKDLKEIEKKLVKTFVYNEFVGLPKTIKEKTENIKAEINTKQLNLFKVENVSDLGTVLDVMYFLRPTNTSDRSMTVSDVEVIDGYARTEIKGKLLNTSLETEAKLLLSNFIGYDINGWDYGWDKTEEFKFPLTEEKVRSYNDLSPEYKLKTVLQLMNLESKNTFQNDFIKQYIEEVKTFDAKERDRVSKLLIIHKLNGVISISEQQKYKLAELTKENIELMINLEVQDLKIENLQEYARIYSNTSIEDTFKTFKLMEYIFENIDEMYNLLSENVLQHQKPNIITISKFEDNFKQPLNRLSIEIHDRFSAMWDANPYLYRTAKSGDELITKINEHYEKNIVSLLSDNEKDIIDTSLFAKSIVNIAKKSLVVRMLSDKYDGIYNKEWKEWKNNHVSNIVDSFHENPQKSKRLLALTDPMSVKMVSKYLMKNAATKHDSTMEHIDLESGSVLDSLSVKANVKKKFNQNNIVQAIKFINVFGNIEKNGYFLDNDTYGILFQKAFVGLSIFNGINVTNKDLIEPFRDRIQYIVENAPKLNEYKNLYKTMYNVATKPEVLIKKSTVDYLKEMGIYKNIYDDYVNTNSLKKLLEEFSDRKILEILSNDNLYAKKVTEAKINCHHTALNWLFNQNILNDTEREDILLSYLKEEDTNKVYNLPEQKSFATNTTYLKRRVATFRKWLDNSATNDTDLKFKAIENKLLSFSKDITSEDWFIEEMSTILTGVQRLSNNSENFLNIYKNNLKKIYQSFGEEKGNILIGLLDQQETLSSSLSKIRMEEMSINAQKEVRKPTRKI